MWIIYNYYIHSCLFYIRVSNTIMYIIKLDGVQGHYSTPGKNLLGYDWGKLEKSLEHHFRWPHCKQFLTPPLGRYINSSSIGCPWSILYLMYMLNFVSSSGESRVGCFWCIAILAFIIAGWYIGLGEMDWTEVLANVSFGVVGMRLRDARLVMDSFGFVGKSEVVSHELMERILTVHLILLKENSLLMLLNCFAGLFGLECIVYCTE